MAHQLDLESESEQRRAEHDGAVHIVVESRRLTPGVDHRNAHVEQEEQDQKRLGTAEMFAAGRSERPTPMRRRR